MATSSTSGLQGTSEVGAFAALKDEGRLPSKAFDEQLLLATTKLPLTESAAELLDYVKSVHRCDAAALANLISRDQKLAAVLLRIANTSIYNRTGRPLSDIAEAIPQVGIKRMSELAVGASLIALAQPPRVLGFDARLAWQRSVAAVLAADQILQWHKPCDESHGIVLCALLTPWGRMLTGTAFASMYQLMIVESHRSQRPLLALEQKLFPRSPSAAMAHVLTATGISADVCRPLAEADLSFSQLVRLDAKIQTRVQILKAAVLLGEFAVAEWLPWDEISFPTNMQLREIGAGAPREIVDSVRAQLQEEASLLSLAPNEPRSTPSTPAGPTPELPYCNLALEVGELLPCLLQSMGLQVRQSTTDDPRAKTGMLINCLHTPISWLAAKARDTPHSGWVMLTTENYPSSWNWLGTFLQTPASYQAIRTACEGILPRKDRHQQTHSTTAPPPSTDHPYPAAPQHSANLTTHSTASPPRNTTPQPNQSPQNPGTYEPLNADA